MPTALFLSPHLDDVAFSCGATLATLARAGWDVTLATVFTASVPDPTGFALECQTSKGVPAGADYMATRRAEDFDAAAALGAPQVRHLGFPEAPHRGYRSAAELFAGVRPGDDVADVLMPALRELAEECRPDVVFAPQGCGGHVDHLQLIAAWLRLPEWSARTAWYRDTPYVIRDPGAAPSPLLPTGLRDAAFDIMGELPAKLTACAAYGTQLPFQFGSAEAMREQLTSLAVRDGGERFRLAPEVEGVCRGGCPPRVHRLAPRAWAGTARDSDHGPTAR